MRRLPAVLDLMLVAARWKARCIRFEESDASVGMAFARQFLLRGKTLLDWKKCQ
jgi:hypothetical protein